MLVTLEHESPQFEELVEQSIDSIGISSALELAGLEVSQLAELKVDIGRTALYHVALDRYFSHLSSDPKTKSLIEAVQESIDRQTVLESGGSYEAGHEIPTPTDGRKEIYLAPRSRNRALAISAIQERPVDSVLRDGVVHYLKAN